MAVVFNSDIELRELLKEYFKNLALDWLEENFCLVDDYIDLNRLSIFLFTKGKQGGIRLTALQGNKRRRSGETR